MPKNCCVPNCRSYYQYGEGKTFHIFPKDPVVMNEWKRRLKIDDESRKSKYQFVCSDHFRKADFNISNHGKKFVLRKGSLPMEISKTVESDEDSEAFCMLKESISSLTWTTLLDDQSGNFELSPIVNSDELTLTNELDVESDEDSMNREEAFLTLDETISSTALDMIDCDEDNSEAWVEKMIQSEKKNDLGVRVEQLKNSDYLRNKNTIDRSVTAKPDMQDKGIQVSFPRKRTSYSSLTDVDLEYFTGLERERFEIVYSILEKFNPIEDNMLLCKKDALVITLFKCRHNEDFKMMEFTFEIDRKVISEIFKEVIGKLYLVLKQIDSWKLSSKNPKAYRCILDCTEMFVVRAGDPNVHQLTFSHYKSHPTFKLLLCCDESGAVNFISDANVGSTSDREIMIKSGILEKLEKGDAIMADKGFDISDLLEEKGVTINIPPFLKGKEQLSEFEVMKTRIIANRRILIENVNCRAKKNKIIATTMQNCLWPYANKIIYVCFALVNFYKPLKDEEDA